MPGRRLAGALSIAACILALQACTTAGRSVAGATARAGSVTPAARCAPVLALVTDGAVVQRAALAADGTFELRFIHSVLGTEVRERYQVRANGIVQVGMRYQGAGYGYPDDTSTSKVRDGEFTEVAMERAIPRLIVRPRAASANRLRARVDHDLVALGTRPIEFIPCNCPISADAFASASPCAVPVRE